MSGNCREVGVSDLGKQLVVSVGQVEGRVEPTGMPFSSQSNFGKKMRKLSLKLMGGWPEDQIASRCLNSSKPTMGNATRQKA